MLRHLHGRCQPHCMSRTDVSISGTLRRPLCLQLGYCMQPGLPSTYICTWHVFVQGQSHIISTGRTWLRFESIPFFPLKLLAFCASPWMSREYWIMLVAACGRWALRCRPLRALYVGSSFLLYWIWFICRIVLLCPTTIVGWLYFVWPSCRSRRSSTRPPSLGDFGPTWTGSWRCRSVSIPQTTD